MRTLLLVTLLALFPHLPAELDERRILIIYETAGFKHDSIPDALRAVTAAAEREQLQVDSSATSAVLTAENLSRYRSVVFLLTTGDILTEDESAALFNFVRAGGGFAGIHSAADTERGNDRFEELLGAEFRTHPAVQQAVVRSEDDKHPSTRHLASPWRRVDEWYDFMLNPRGRVHVLATVDEATYAGGQSGDHPIAWCSAYGAGRSWYTAMGHTSESYAEPSFIDHLLGGIRWSAGLESGDCDTRRGNGQGLFMMRNGVPATLQTLSVTTHPGDVISLRGSVMAKRSGPTVIRIRGAGEGSLRLTGLGEVRLEGSTADATFALKGGVRYPLSLLYRATAPGALEVTWETAGRSEEVIAIPQLYPPRVRPSAVD